MKRRVLFISYPFPPVGGAGVQRTAKFVKYLPQFGWTASVLTASNPSVPVYDTTLLGDIPPDTIVRRTKTLEPGYAAKQSVSAERTPDRFAERGGALVRTVARRLANTVLQPDPQILWNRGAIREGMRLLGEMPHAAIVATGPPFSSFLIGEALSRRTGVPLVVDYRDEWTLSNAYLENRQLGRLAQGLQNAMQRRILRCATAVVATTQHSERSLRAIGTGAGSRARFTCIYNGFDHEDFPPSEAAGIPASGSFRLVYTGTLWNLTSIEPLVEAILVLAKRAPKSVARLELVLAGRRTPAQARILKRLDGLPLRLTEHAYVDHGAAVSLMRSAHALLLLLSDVAGAERVVPAKLFEYVAARRPILGVTPRGEAWDLLARQAGSAIFVPGDTDGLVRFLAAGLESPPQKVSPSSSPDPSEFDRRQLAGRLAHVLDACAVPGRTA